MGNIIVVAVLICVVGAAIYYLYKAKKNGQSCIGCPYSGQCASKKSDRPGKSCDCGKAHLNKTKE